jgi:hypothetical protein
MRRALLGLRTGKMPRRGRRACRVGEALHTAASVTERMANRASTPPQTKQAVPRRKRQATSHHLQSHVFASRKLELLCSQVGRDPTRSATRPGAACSGTAHPAYTQPQWAACGGGLRARLPLLAQARHALGLLQPPARHLRVQGAECAVGSPKEALAQDAEMQAGNQHTPAARAGAPHMACESAPQWNWILVCCHNPETAHCHKVHLWAQQH